MNLPISRFYILIALVIGALYALNIFDVSFIFGQSVYWTQPLGDRITNMIGTIYFAQDNWRWPLFYVPILAFPEGANIIFTDSIPLLALAAKIVYKITGEWYNYFGFWIFACFLFLAAFVARTIKEGGGKDLVAIIGAVILALASPALLVRFGHASLMAHFMIAWSFLLYLKFGRTSSLRSSTLQFALVASLSVVLQTYFLLMVMPFFIAALIQSKIVKRISLRDTIVSFSVVVASIIFIAVIAGVIGPGSSVASAWGFGHYSMNIFSPFLPPREHLPSFVAKLITWDGNGYSWDATGGQYEGYNYLGAGLLSLIIIHIAFSRSLIQETIKRNKLLVLMLTCLLLLALSTRVYFGSWLVLNLEPLNVLIKPLIGHFRTSGRFFWPIYYVLIVFLVLLTFKRFSPNMARAVIIAAVVIQLIDTQPLRHNMAQAAKQSYPQVLPKKEWTELLNEHKYVKQYPSFQCGGWANNRWPENNSNMELLLLAARLNKPSNSAYLARLFRNCADELEEGLSFKLQDEGLYIYSGRAMTRHIERLPDFQERCREFKFGFVCTQKWTFLPQLLQSTEFQKVRVSPIPEYHLGDTLEFTINGKADRFLGDGWSVSEPWGTWSAAKESEILLKLVALPRDSIVMRVNARAFLHANRPEKNILVYVNGEKAAIWKYVIGEDIVTRAVIIPWKYFQKDGMIRITLVSQVTESPLQAGFSKDKRQISLGLVSLTATPILTNLDDTHLKN